MKETTVVRASLAILAVIVGPRCHDPVERTPVRAQRTGASNGEATVELRRAVQCAPAGGSCVQDGDCSHDNPGRALGLAYSNGTGGMAVAMDAS